MKKVIVTITAAVVLSGCGSDSSTTIKQNQTDLERATVEVIDNSIIPAANNFATEVTTLKNSVTDYCADNNNKTDEQLSALQTAWKNTADSWYQISPYNFGPLINNIVLPEYIYIDSYRQRGINYTASIRTSIQQLMNNTQTLNDAYFANQNASLQGLPALEVALFESTTQDTQLSAINNEFINQNRKCGIITGYANQLHKRAETVKNGWTINYKNSGKSYRDLLISGELSTLTNEDENSAQKKIILAQQDFLNYLKQRAVVVNVAKLSGNIWPMQQKAASALGDMINGTSATTISYADLMKNGAANDLTTLQDNLNQANINITDQDVAAYNATIGLLDGNLKRELSDGIGITLGINFADGD